MKITVGTRCSAPIQLDTGTVQGSVLSPLLFDLFLNALLRLLDATGITHGIKRTPQWNHAAFADDLSIYVGTVAFADDLSIYVGTVLEQTPDFYPKICSHRGHV